MIRVLSKNVADKIAAGEVVERPLSIVKELVENAIDANADSIIVEIQNGGKTYIRVTDNGCGIPADEVLLAFKRHATSKIETDKDLEKIETLGFRGEALASVAAVSRIEMITKTSAEKTGTRVRIEGSEVVANAPTGCPDGTTIIVTDLFYNTPARQKFMKSDAAESTLIIDLISKLALAYASIRMRLVSNGNTLFSTQGKGNLLNAILTVYSREISDHLIPVCAQRDDLELTGYVSPPGYSKSNRKMQIFFVNGRVVSSKVMDKGVSDAYFDKLFDSRYPICFLFLKAAPDKLDVNIHPNKKEVRFDDERLVTDFLSEAIRKALAVKEAIPEVKLPASEVKPNNPFQLKEAPDHDFLPAFKEEAQSESNEFLKSQKQQVDIKNLLSTIRKEDEELEREKQIEFLKEDSAPYAQNAHKSVPQSFDMTALTQMGSIFATYLIAADEDSLYLIDQHAAHERVFFEQLMGQYKNSEKLQQTILTPFIINVSYAVKNDAFDWLDTLSGVGFDLEEFGPKAFLVKAVPMFMSFEEANTFIEYFLDNISETTDLSDPVKIEKIISASCKNAVKANDRLTSEEIRQLIADLARCENPYSCPHGRPTFIKLTKDEIEKMFKRK